jgi:branched-chain amino acid transport system permease protein/neutral amino acid transport system permease protein
MTGSLFVQSIGFGLVTASILALASVGFTLQFGVSNILNLAYGDLMTASAFAGYAVNQAGGSVPESLAAGAGFGALASMLLNRYVYRPFVRHGTKLFGMVVVTLAVGIILQNILLSAYGATFFSYSFSTGRQVHILGMVFDTSQLMIIGLSVVVMILVQLLLTRTRLGKAMRATAANPGLAQASGALCGLAGVVLVLNTSAFQSTTGNDFLVIIVAAAMLGGVGNPTGAMLASIVLGVVTEVAAGFLAPSFKEVIAFGMLVVVLLFRPTGIFGQGATVKEIPA